MEDEHDESLSFSGVALAISEFLEVAIHMILYARQVYPVDLFVRRKKYNAPVYQSRHPVLNEYVAGAVKAIGDELLLGNLDKVVIVIKDKSEIALERFIFSLRSMITVEPENRDAPVQNALSPDALPHHFRSFLVKLSMMESQLLDIPVEDRPTFAIVIELKDGRVPTASEEDEPVPWMPALQQHTTSGASEGAELHVVRAVETGVINMTLVVQESEEKLAREKAAMSSKAKGKQKAS